MEILSSSGSANSGTGKSLKILVHWAAAVHYDPLLMVGGY